MALIAVFERGKPVPHRNAQEEGEGRLTGLAPIKRGMTRGELGSPRLGQRCCSR